MPRRFALSLLMLALLAAPAVAADGTSPYGNVRFGYWVSIPAGFTCGPEADDSDGKSCTSADGMATLDVWGGFIDVPDSGSFGAQAAFDKASDQRDGLVVTYQATGSNWASYSGMKDGRIVYVRMIGGCKDSQFAGFQLNYPPSEAAAMKPVLNRLVPSLRQETCAQ
jgi:hypothetical protein